MTQLKNPKGANPWRTVAIVAATLSAGLLFGTPPQAFERVATGVERLLFCTGLLLSDPAAHSQNCLPFRGAAFTESFASQGDDDFVATIAAPVEPVEEPEEPVEEPPPGNTFSDQ